MKCPTCGADGAYVGLEKIECQNHECKHHVDGGYYRVVAPVKLSAPACDHEWEQAAPVVDLSILQKCRKCPKTRRRTLAGLFFDQQKIASP